MITKWDRYLFTDKITGKTVEWKKDRFDDVKKDHPEVYDYLSTVAKAIESPDIVKKDVYYVKSRKIYYLCFCGGKNFKNHHMKVTVEQGMITGNLRVITAYFTDHFKEGEDLVWSKT